jgi:phosphatidylglycerophosphate synthase
LKPNQISVASIFVAAGAGACLWWSGVTPSRTAGLLLIAAAALIQVRLLCNLFDGMVAVEGGLKTKSGEIYNELPDRFADAFILIGAGYAAPHLSWMPLAGWLAALAAVITAYVRTLGASAGTSQYFCGPMAKQERMAIVTFASIIAAIIGWSLGLLVIGCVVTIARRFRRIIHELENK